MGTPGVPWNVPKARIVESIKKQQGRLTYVARELDCAWVTLKKRIDADPELAQLVADTRLGFGETLLDFAESALMKGLTSNKAADYLKSSFFVLNNKGKERGYNPPEGMQIKISPAEIAEAAKAGKLTQPD